MEEYESVPEIEDFVRIENIDQLDHAAPSNSKKCTESQGLPTPPREPQWMKQIIGVIYKFNHKRWLKRNNNLHKNKPIDRVKHEQLCTQITALDLPSEDLLETDQYCFQKPLAEWEQSTVYKMKRWFHTFTLHIRHCRLIARTHRKN